MLHRRILINALCLALSTGLDWAQQEITIDPQASSSAFAHFWEEAFGSGRAILTLRESYRNDLVAVKQAT
jgi:xylan 1,4-beta-xylosidase